MMKIVIACDHAGFRLKERLKKYLIQKKMSVLDVGPSQIISTDDYPDYCLKLAEAVSQGKAQMGILTCKSGIGMSICANKVKGIRAALCHNEKEVRYARGHNGANVLVLGGGLISFNQAKKIIQIWFSTKFEGGRHGRRIRKIQNYEKRHWK